MTADTPSTAVAPRPTPELSKDLAEVRQLGYWLALAETGQTTPEALGAGAALRHYYARMLGLPDLAAGEISFIKGRLFLSSKLLRALAAGRGYRVVLAEANSEGATAAVLRADTGEEVGRSTYTMADAKRAGLIRDGGGWTKNPDRMLWARAAKRALDDHAPEITLGIHTNEEAIEINAEELPDDADLGGIPFGPGLDATAEYDAATEVREQDAQAELPE